MEQPLSSMLIIGTAQFGMNYGVSSDGGRTDENELKKILQVVSENFIDTFDTAPIYGKSQLILGNELPSHFKIITKVSSISATLINDEVIDMVNVEFNQSLQDLNRYRVHALLVHSAKDLLKPGGEKLIDWLQKKKGEQRSRGNWGFNLYPRRYGTYCPWFGFGYRAITYEYIGPKAY